MRVRLRYSKSGKVRFTSHRDVARIFERALRRAALPVASTEGFSPRAKVHFGLALPTGYESSAEFLDVDFREGEPLPVPDDLPAMLTPLLAPGIEVTAAAIVDPGEPSLQEAVTSCTWSIGVVGPGTGGLAERVEHLLGATEIVVTRQRKGKDVTDDIRPYVLALEVRDGAGECVLDAELGTKPRGLRPNELLAALGVPGPEGQGVEAEIEEGLVRRSAQWITRPDGSRGQPLELSELSPPGDPSLHAAARA